MPPNPFPDASRDGPGGPGPRFTVVLHPKASVGEVKVLSATDDAQRASDVRTAISGALTGLQYCYESALKLHPTLVGELGLGWTIADGATAPEGLEVRSDTVGEPALADCVARRLSRLQVPAGSAAVVDARFRFEQLRAP